MTSCLCELHCAATRLFQRRFRRLDVDWSRVGGLVLAFPLELASVYSKLRQHGRYVQTQRLQLLKQAENECRSCACYSPDPARSITISLTVALFDDNHFVDVSKRGCDRSENACRSLQHARQSFQNGL